MGHVPGLSPKPLHNTLSLFSSLPFQNINLQEETIPTDFAAAASKSRKIHVQLYQIPPSGGTTPRLAHLSRSSSQDEISVV